MSSEGGITKIEIALTMQEAFDQKQFVAYYQPQYNHSTGMLIGAEALARWIHPVYGFISPAEFIPVFEKTGFISKFDLYIFEEVCAFLRKAIDAGLNPVPISTNITRYDMFAKGFIHSLEEIRKKYDIPARLIRVEITESAAFGSTEKVNECIRAIHDYGFKVEMDDFGSGYSSLNMLKDLDADIIKLDMEFLRGNEKCAGKGGTILCSVVRMMKWLQIPVIAEGVETVEQADFLRSIGCNYVQGYLYSKPIPEKEFMQKLGSKTVELEKITVDTDKNLSRDSFEKIILSSYVGAVCIFSYCGGNVDILQVNRKYLQEIGMNLDESSIIKGDPWEPFDEENKKVYIDTLENAIKTGEEAECETKRRILSSCCGDECMYVRSTLKVIGESMGEYIFYCMIRNITTEKLQQLKLLGYKNSLSVISEQVNIYYWEYNVSTKEMRPCFRCMRDLGLPPVVKNYPEPAIAIGIFPEDYADMYRDWHRQIENGVKELEAVIPLTVGRVPFRVRYTTEFDEHGRPVKAYGSATLVKEDKT